MWLFCVIWCFNHRLLLFLCRERLCCGLSIFEVFLQQIKVSLHQLSTNHLFDQACSIIKATCIFEEFEVFDNFVTISCKRASWMIPHGLEIATPGKWSTSKIVKNFTGTKLCLLQSQFFFVFILKIRRLWSALQFIFCMDGKKKQKTLLFWIICQNR